MGKTLTKKDMQRIASKILTCSIQKKDVKLSSKQDFVDRTQIRVEKLIAKLQYLAEH